jgi:hypothetical protein
VFYLERSNGRNGSRSAPEVAVSPSVEVSDTKRTPPIDEEPRDAAVIARRGFDVDDIEIDDFDHALLWIDRMREVVAREDPKLTDEGARRLGEFTTHTAVSEETTSIELTESEGGRPLLTVGHGNGYSSMGVGLCFDLKAKHVIAGADSAEDVFPQPQPAWMGIEGTVVVSSWDWSPRAASGGGMLGPDHRPVVIEYDLFGRRGHEPCSTHGKVVLAP